MKSAFLTAAAVVAAASQAAASITVNTIKFSATQD
jgi:hypothetical protein